MLSFNVYLNDAPGISRYVSRLQNLAGDRPPLLAELGADGRSLGCEQQAAVIGSQVDTELGRVGVELRAFGQT
jgi:hypothetical protein